MDSAALTKVIFLICVATAAIFLVEAIYLAFVVPISRKRSVNRRLRMVDEGFVGEQASIRLKERRGIFDRDIELMGRMSKLLVQSGLPLTMGKFFAIIIALFLAILVVLQVITSFPSWACFIAAIIFGIWLPIMIVKFVRNRRRKLFSEQLPDALDVIVRSLKAGHPVPTALGLVGREMPDPVGTEFGLTLDEMTYGLELPLALVNLSNRIGVADLSLLVTAVSIQSGMGGNLSEILQNLSKVLRERFQLRRKVRAISAEGRFSAYGLIILPIIIFFAIYLPNPNYYTDVWPNPIFKVTMIGLCVWSFIGNIISYKMINFKF